MGKEVQDGLIMDQSVFMIDEKGPGFPVSARVIQILAIMLGCWCFIAVLREGLAIPFDMFDIYTAAFICIGVMFTLCLIPSYELVKLFFCILFYGLFFYSRLPRLTNGFYMLENLIMDRMASYYNYQSQYYLADYSRQQADVSLLIIMLLIPIIALLVIAVVRNRFISVSSIVLFIPVVVCFLFGLIPSEKYLFLYVVVELYLTRAGGSIRDIASKEQRTLIHRINSRAAVWLSLIGILIFFILKLFVTESGYKDISEINVMKDKVQTTLMNFSIEDYTDKMNQIQLFDTSTSTGGLRGGKLGRNGEVKYTDSEQLVVTAPYESIAEGIYLKGYVGSEYTGDSWEEHSKEDSNKYKELLKSIPVKEFPPVNQTYQLLDLVLNKKALSGNGSISLSQLSAHYQIYQGTLEIEYKDANKKYIYAPYFTNYEILGQSYYEQDLFSAPKKKKKEYKFDYFYNLSLGYMSYSIFSNKNGQLGNYPDYEKLYRDYVYQVYTKLPEKGLDQIKYDFSERKMTSIDSSITGKIDYVKSYLQDNTSYTLSPGKLPKGKDFVEYFLYENRKGYCAHYASAATLMLRAMGVPARYVEGYAIGPDQVIQSQPVESKMIAAYSANTVETYDTMMSKISVMDNNAHAWVEVYMDGYGWLPVEFTPGSAIENNTAAIDELSQAKYYMNQTKDKEIVPTLAPATPTPVIKDQETEKIVDNMDKQTSSSGVAEKKTQAKLDFIFAIIFILLVIAVVSLLLISKMRKFRRITNSTNRNKRAIYLFVEIEKILAASKGLPGSGARLEDCIQYVTERSPYIDSKEFDTCMETVKKARFGRGRITASELKEVEALRHQLYSKVYKELPITKKAYLKLILLM